MKQLKQPPDLVKRVFDMVLILFQKEVVPSQAETVTSKRGDVLQLCGSWQFSLPMMADIGFLPSLEKFQKDAINDETVELLGPYLAAPDMTPEDARKVASALAGLCTWARAMALYVGIAKVVKPKMESLKIAEGKLKSANAKLAKAQGELDQVQSELDEMQRQFDDAIDQKRLLQEDADACTKKMDAANRLIGGLAGERKRWEEQSSSFADEIRRLAGDVALACAFITYVGPYNAEFRKRLQDKLFYSDCQAKGVPVTEDLGISLFLVDAATIGDWNLEGLPSDDLSVENGIMVTRSQKWPLMIDPQSQGLGWIKSREAKNSIKSTQLIDKRFRNHLEDSMAFGTPLMIENVEEEIDPVLDPVLNKEIQRKGRNLIIQLADKECEYSDSFNLFLCSKLANPHYSPEVRRPGSTPPRAAAPSAQACTAAGCAGPARSPCPTDHLAHHAPPTTLHPPRPTHHAPLTTPHPPRPTHHAPPPPPPLPTHHQPCPHSPRRPPPLPPPRTSPRADLRPGHRHQLHRDDGRPRAAAALARRADGAARARGAEEEARRGGQS